MARRLITIAAILAAVATHATAQDTPSPSAPSKVVVAQTRPDDAPPEMAAEALKERLAKGERVVIVDTRHGLKGQILAGAVNVTFEQLGDWAKGKDRTTTLVTYCTCPHDAGARGIARELRSMGFVRVYVLAGGLRAAQAAGIPVVVPAV